MKNDFYNTFSGIDFAYRVGNRVGAEIDRETERERQRERETERKRERERERESFPDFPCPPRQVMAGVDGGGVRWRI